MAMGLNNHGWAENMDGFVNPPEINLFTIVARGRAVINIDGLNIDLGTLGKPDGNSWINWGGISERGEAVGMSETAVPDPDGEDIRPYAARRHKPGDVKRSISNLWHAAAALL
jgi:hypothetical protein